MFDADGVAIKPWGFALALNDNYGITLDDTKEFFAGPFRRCLTGHSDLSNSLAPFLDAWRWPGTTREFIDLWMKLDDQPESRVISQIRQLKGTGAECYLASNQESTRAAYIRDRMRFDELFNRLYFSCEIGYAKPDRRFFDAIAEDISVRPSEIRFWDDSSAYVEAAKTSGWDARLFTDLSSLESISCV